MQTTLLQEKLDVVQKNRANLFSWRGQFTPQLIEYLLCNYAKPGDVVADPFVGSGTVLLESINRDINSFGFEINPAAYAMSRFYSLANLSLSERKEIFAGVESKLERLLRHCGSKPIFLPGDGFREQYSNLITFTTNLFASLESKIEKVIALNLLFICEGRKKNNLESSAYSALCQIRNFAFSLPFTSRSISVYLEDARRLHLRVTQRPNLIITSPPYINVFNYHQNHRAILEAIGWDMLSVAQSEFGANRKNRANRFKTVIQYTLDMEQALRSFWSCLQDNGVLILIVGRESNVCSAPFYNGQIISDLLTKSIGFARISTHERSFVNKFGVKIREDLLILRKNNSLAKSFFAQEIASEHLEKALKTAPDKAKNDILEALAQVSTVTPSPLFSAKAALRNE